MIIEEYTITRIEQVEKLDETVRGDGGFGSTGLVNKQAQELSKKRTLTDYFNKQ